mgnify:FL=1
MFCKNCGVQISEETKFCPSCGNSVVDNKIANENNSEEKIIIECKGSLQGGGMGKIILTDKNIIWSSLSSSLF